MVLVLRQNRLLAAEAVNAPGHHIATRRLIGAPSEVLTAHGFDLKLVAKAAAVT